MRYLGLDYGSKTLGLAISDTTGIISSPLEVIRYEDINELISKLKNIIIEKKVDALVLGLPLNLDGSVSVRCEKTKEFANIIKENIDIEIYFQDERLSTVEAQNILISNSTRRDKRKTVIDKMAATIILQTYLDRCNNGKK